MATLSVWRFDTPEGSDLALDTLAGLQRRQLMTVHDAATVSWPTDGKRPRTHQAADLTGAGALSGDFWGLLFGLIFFVSLLGAAVGAAAGALRGSMADVGIDDDVIREVRDQVTPGTSALFVTTSGAVVDRVEEAFAVQEAQLIYTNLSHEEEQKLREVVSGRPCRDAACRPAPRRHLGTGRGPLGDVLGRCGPTRSGSRSARCPSSRSSSCCCPHGQQRHRPAS